MKFDFLAGRSKKKRSETEVATTVEVKECTNKYEKYQTMQDFFDRFDDFVADKNRAMPREAFERFMSDVKERIGEEGFKEYSDYLIGTKYKAIYEILYAGEFVLGLNYRPGTLRSSQVFYRGKGDIANSKKTDNRYAMHEGMYERRRASLDELFTGDIANLKYENICEVGGAWGSTMRYLMERFNPDKYYNFEIDGQWAEWTHREFGSITMPADGETLEGVDDRSIDMMVCFDVLPWMPPLKIYSYLMEFARVARRGALIGFNLFVGDYLTSENAKKLLIDSFPRRHFSHVPRQFILNSFPESRFEILLENNMPPAGADKITYVIRCNEV